MRNAYTNTTKMLFNFLIRKSNNLQSVSLKYGRALQIIRLSLRSVMLRTVYLDNQPCPKTIKIRYKG